LIDKPEEALLELCVVENLVNVFAEFFGV